MPKVGEEKTAKGKATQAVEMFDKGGVGRKYCPKCEQFFKGPTRKNCPKCGTAIPTKDKGASSKTDRSSDPFKLLDAVISYANEHGGIDSAKEDLKAVERLITACGGLAQAKAALERLGSLPKIK